MFKTVESSLTGLTDVDPFSVVFVCGGGIVWRRMLSDFDHVMNFGRLYGHHLEVIERRVE